MSGPSKKRKKLEAPITPRKPKQMQTLDRYFSPKAITKSSGPPPDAMKSPIRQPDPEAKPGMTDEEYARMLAEQWAQEDEEEGSRRREDEREDEEQHKRERSGMRTKVKAKEKEKVEPEPPEPDTQTKEAVTESSAAVLRRSKRRRDSSQERRDYQLSKALRDHAEGKDPEGFAIMDETFDTEVQVPSSLPENLGQSRKFTDKDDELLRYAVDVIPFGKSPLEFEPDQYACLHLPEGGQVPYSLLVRAFVLVNSTRSRIAIVDTLVNCLRTIIRLDPESLLPAVWLSTNDIGPPYERNDLGIGSSVISKAIISCTGLNAAQLKKLAAQHGDAGDVAFTAKSKQKTLSGLRAPTPLTIIKVYKSLVEIASASGKGSLNVKEGLVKRLFVNSEKEEARYLVRTFAQHLRIGAVKTTMLTALARAFLFTKPKCADWECPEIPANKDARQELFQRAEETVKQAFARRPNYNDLVPLLLKGSIAEVEKNCDMTIHVPIKPMLGSITRDLDEMLVKLQDRDFACEYKYDGQRAQIHYDDRGKISIFSRHLDLMTDKYPDLVELVPKICGPSVRSFVLEGEVVAINRDTGQLLPFQTLSSRERKNVSLQKVTVGVCLYAFDLMWLNGTELLSMSFRERRELLRSKFKYTPHHFEAVKSFDATSANPSAVRKFFQSAVKSKCEGIMVKVLDNLNKPVHLTIEEEAKKVVDAAKKRGGASSGGSRRKPLLATYEPDKRLESWLKVKKDYAESADTLDLIPIGAWHGMGRKSKWWSPILLAVRNPDTGSLEAVCKCMSGFTDKTYTEMKEFYAEDSDNVCAKKAYYEAALGPVVWFEPTEVWEVAFADITLSPVYTAALGLVSDERGLSLRFPRFLRRRPDKSIDEASTSQYLADLYYKQAADSGSRHSIATPDEIDIDGDMQERSNSQEPADVRIRALEEQEQDLMDIEEASSSFLATTVENTPAESN